MLHGGKEKRKIDAPALLLQDKALDSMRVRTKKQPKASARPCS